MNKYKELINALAPLEHKHRILAAMACALDVYFDDSRYDKAANILEDFLYQLSNDISKRHHQLKSITDNKTVLTRIECSNELTTDFNKEK